MDRGDFEENSQDSSQGRSRLLVILGPTASGKSSLALKLALRLGGEIINCDSMQMIQELQVGTAKPSKEEMSAVPHHLFGTVRLGDFYSAGAYMTEARNVCADVARRGKLPIVVGGTGLYLRALLEGVFEGPGKSEALRERLKRVGERRGCEFLHRWLLIKDPEAASRIQPRDMVRTVRALEVVLASGRSISELQRKTLRLEGFDVLKIGLRIARKELYDRINRRVLRMFGEGLLDEVEGLLDEGYPSDTKGFEALGYRYAIAVLTGNLPLEEAVRLTQRDTRRYAKRQLTWFGREEGCNWIPYAGEDPLAFSRALAIFKEERFTDGV